VTTRRQCSERVCETKISCDKDLSNLELLYSPLVNATYKKMGQDYIAKYPSALYNCKVSTILVLLGVYAKYIAIPLVTDGDNFFTNVILPLICYVEKSGLAPQQQQYEASIANALSIAVEYFLIVTFQSPPVKVVNLPQLNADTLNQAFLHMKTIAGCVVKDPPVLQAYP
jgi:hypothetical protein